MPDFCYCHVQAITSGLCEVHFREQKLAPLLKERDNSQALVDLMSDQICAYERELARATNRIALTGDERQVGKVRFQPIGRKSDGVRIFCHKCGKAYPIGQSINCLDHERNCKVVASERKRQSTSPKSVREAPQRGVVIERELEDSELG